MVWIEGLSSQKTGNCGGGLISENWKAEGFFPLSSCGFSFLKSFFPPAGVVWVGVREQPCLTELIKDLSPEYILTPSKSIFLKTMLSSTQKFLRIENACNICSAHLIGHPGQKWYMCNWFSYKKFHLPPPTYTHTHTFPPTEQNEPHELRITYPE